MTGSGGKVLSAFVEEVSPMRTHLRDDSWRPYVIPNKVSTAVPMHAASTWNILFPSSIVTSAN